MLKCLLKRKVTWTIWEKTFHRKKTQKTGNKISHRTQRWSHPEGKIMSIDLMALHKSESFSPSFPSAINWNKWRVSLFRCLSLHKRVLWQILHIYRHSFCITSKWVTIFCLLRTFDFQGKRENVFKYLSLRIIPMLFTSDNPQLNSEMLSNRRTELAMFMIYCAVNINKLSITWYFFVIKWTFGERGLLDSCKH